MKVLTELILFNYYWQTQLTWRWHFLSKFLICHNWLRAPPTLREQSLIKIAYKDNLLTSPTEGPDFSHQSRMPRSQSTPNDWPMLGHRLRRWPNIGPSFGCSCVYISPQWSRRERWEGPWSPERLLAVRTPSKHMDTVPYWIRPDEKLNIPVVILLESIVLSIK